MTTSADIDPNVIGSAPVGKEAMRQQLRNIKDSIAALEQQNANTTYPWVRLSHQVLAVSAAFVNVAMPPGYNRYRVEYQNLRPVGVPKSMFMRFSTNGGISFITTVGQYDGNTLEWNTSGVTPLLAHDVSGAIAFSGIQQHDTSGAFGAFEFTGDRLGCEFSCNYITTGGVRNSRRGWFGLGGSANMLQFFCSGGTPNLAVDSTFTVLART